MPTNRRIFIKQLGLGALGAGILATLPKPAHSSPAKFSLPRSTPEQQGISSAGLQAFLEAIEKSKIEFHSVMIVRHGNVIAEGWWSPYTPALKHTLYSLSKSFTSTAVGFAVTEGRLTVEATVVSFFPNDVPKTISPHLAAMKVKHLLTMSTGHAKDTIQSLRGVKNDNWVKAFLELPVEDEPGTHFVYNTGATYMLSAILQKATGQTVLEYLKPRLFEPLGIEDMDWETNSQGINVGGYGLRVKTEDIAKLGLLYLQKGKMNGKQIIPEKWIVEATTSHIESSPSVRKRPKEEDDWSQGYGYQFWRCTHGAYRGDGAFGQFCIVLPDKDMVVAITGESFDLQGSMNLVWSYLLPAVNDTALPDDNQALTMLQLKLKNLALDPPKSTSTSPVAARITGKKFTLDTNEFKAKTVSFQFSDAGCLFTLNDEKGDHRINCGLNKWVVEENAKTQLLFPLQGRPEVSTPLAASATWTDPNTLTMTFRYAATAHSDSVICKFDGNAVTLQFLNSVAKGNPESAEKRVPIQGRM